ncbi:hypothetical protein ACFWH4_01530 [Streptomyces sp. NPDC127091]|uniref:hypothetical protein n=1 Tax=Streptomyces sp. NPDC127091 TaxID=3347134 RepID=UPI003651E62A
MTRSGHSINRDLGAALKRAAQRTGEQAPSVRGSDWSGAVVTAVGSNGTVDADGLEGIRCMETYSQPAVGDLIYITQSSSGNWLAWGRTATTSQGWTTLTHAAGYGNPGHGYTAAYMREGRRIWLRGRIGPVAAGERITGGATLLTVPAAIRPAGGTEIGWAVARDQSISPATCRVEITTAGILRTYDASSTLPSWVALDGITYTI